MINNEGDVEFPVISWIILFALISFLLKGAFSPENSTYSFIGSVSWHFKNFMTISLKLSMFRAPISLHESSTLSLSIFVISFISRHQCTNFFSSIPMP